MATYNLIIHVYEHQHRPWTYSVRFMRKVDSANVRFPILSFTGTLPADSVEDPRVILETVLRRARVS